MAQRQQRLGRGGGGGREQRPRLPVLAAVVAADGLLPVFGRDLAAVWLGLMPPDHQGQRLPLLGRGARRGQRREAGERGGAARRHGGHVLGI